MVLLIDTNIMIDVLKGREEFLPESLQVFKICETGKAKGYISALSFVNAMYILRKDYNKEKISEVYKIITYIFSFVELNQNIINESLEMNWNDFEDAIQEVTAESIDADYIVTRNIKDFKDSKVEVITPAELISKFV